MWFCFTRCVIVVILAFLSVLWWRRLRGLCKLPDRRDWQWEKLSLALVGRVLLNKALIRLSADGLGLCSLPGSCLAWGDPDLESTDSLVGLMETWRGLKPRGTFQDCCCQCSHPCDEPLLTYISTVDPPTRAGSFGSVFCGVTAPFLWGLVCARFCLCPPRL